MSNQRPSFAKREREMKLKDKARAKAERRAARKLEKASGPTLPLTPDGAAGVTSPTPDNATDAAPQQALPPAADRSR